MEDNNEDLYDYGSVSGRAQDKPWVIWLCILFMILFTTGSLVAIGFFSKLLWLCFQFGWQLV